MDAALRAFVRERAGRRCEYCHLHEEDAGKLSFQIEHINARQHGGVMTPKISATPARNAIGPKDRI